MNFVETAKLRYSCRKYTNEVPSDVLLLELLEAARIAPSAVNYQPWEFIVCKTEESKQLIYESYNRDWFKSAPILIIACGDHSKSWKRADGKDHCDIDLAIAVDHITLQAVVLGLATCWVCNFNAQLLSKNLNLSNNLLPIVIIPVGFPSDTGDTERFTEKRKTIEEIVRWA